MEDERGGSAAARLILRAVAACRSLSGVLRANHGNLDVTLHFRHGRLLPNWEAVAHGSFRDGCAEEESERFIPGTERHESSERHDN